MFALRTTIVCEPMPEANVSNSFSNIGLILVFVRRANTRFAPTLVLLIGLFLVFVRDEHEVRPTRRITKYLLRSTRKFMIAYLIMNSGLFILFYWKKTILPKIWGNASGRSWLKPPVKAYHINQLVEMSVKAIRFIWWIITFVKLIVSFWYFKLFWDYFKIEEL